MLHEGKQSTLKPLQNGLDNGAQHIEIQLDTLGYFGWDLIAVVGTIGGDQEYILKRPYDPNISKNEQVLVQKYLAEKQSKQAAAPALPKLINLDDVEEKAQYLDDSNQTEKDLRNILSDAFSNSVTAIDFDWAGGKESEYSLSSLVITVKLNVTSQFLIGEDSYRSSLLQQYITNKFDAIKSRMTYTSYGGPKIRILSYITVKGNDMLAYEFKKLYKTPYTGWSSY